MNTVHTPHSIPPTSSSSPHTASGIQWFVVSLGLFGLIVGFAAGKFQRMPPPAPTPKQAAIPSPTRSDPANTAPIPLSVPKVDLATDHVRGSKDATVAFIEYMDFECPVCKRAHPTFQQLMSQYDGKVLWIIRQYPLNFHQNAAKEAEATECAAELGGNEAFWKFADGLIERTTSNGTGFPLDQLPSLAKQIGLDEQQFTACLNSGKYAEQIAKETAAGSAGGVTGTPDNFIVNLKNNTSLRLDGAYPAENFQRLIDAQL